MSAAQTARMLNSSVRDGLPDEEAQARFQKYGPNKLEESEAVRWYHMLARQFANLLILILAVAAGLSYFLGDLIEALAIFSIIILNGLLGFLQEWKAETALKGLQKMLSPHCRVIRGGQALDIEASLLVPGDLVILESGNVIPADIRLTEAVNLRADEAALTGESVPVSKGTGSVAIDAHISSQNSMVWMSTHVVNGRGQGIVVATGMGTEFGRIAGLTGQIKETTTRLQRQLTHLGRQLAVLAVSVAALTVFVGWLWGKPLTQTFLAGVSLAVAAVPEGLPAVVTITLALGVSMMARRKALLRHLQAAETLGATSVICTDKTGTLTKNEMTIQKIWLASGTIDVSGAGYEPAGTFSKNGQEIAPPENPDLSAFLETGRKCNNAEIVYEGGAWQAHGSSTEAAFLAAAEKAGVREAHGYEVCCEFSFNSVRKRMSVVEKSGDHMVAHVKGAPEVLLARAGYIMRDGKAVPLDDELRASVQQAYHDLAEGGMRTLAVAQKILPSGSELNEETAESELVIIGIAGIIDPPRSEVKEAITKTRSAGIRVIMITGDAPETALAVARQIGLDAERAVTGAELAGLDDAALEALLRKGIVFARTVPEDKYRIVKLLQAQNQIVAMTGDGVNDAPALKQADIGIAMGIRGTDVAKGAADMVLTDDNFASIVSAVEEGRRQYANIRKFVRYLTSSNIGETLAIFISILFGLPLILLPIQILWVNLVTDSVTALSLSVEKAEGDIMDEPPRPPSQPILDRTAILMLGAFGSYIGVATLGLFLFYLDSDEMMARTVAFTGMVMMANIHTLNFRSLHAPLSRVGWLSNPWILLAIGAMVCLQIAAVSTPFLQAALDTVPLQLKDWAIIVAVSLPLLVGTEIYKTVKFRKVKA